MKKYNRIRVTVFLLMLSLFIGITVTDGVLSLKDYSNSVIIWINVASLIAISIIGFVGAYLIVKLNNRWYNLYFDYMETEPKQRAEILKASKRSCLGLIGVYFLGTLFILPMILLSSLKLYIHPSTKTIIGVSIVVSQIVAMFIAYRVYKNNLHKQAKNLTSQNKKIN